MNDIQFEPYASRLAALRKLMAGHRLDVYLVPAADEHQNEYLPKHKKRREAISGFAGSAGDVAVCPEEAHLFVDSRYHLQAEQEVPTSVFQVHKLGLEGVTDLREWIASHEEARGALRVGYDPFVITRPPASACSSFSRRRASFSRTGSPVTSSGSEKAGSAAACCSAQT